MYLIFVKNLAQTEHPMNTSTIQVGVCKEEAFIHSQVLDV